MNRYEKAQEFESKIYAGKIGSCSIDELHEYIEALSDFSTAKVAEYPQRASHIQTLNNLISSETLKAVNITIAHAEDTIKDLNAKNTKLTRWVIFLAIITAATGLAQLWFSYSSNKTISEKTTQYTQEPEEFLLPKEHNDRNEQKSFTPPLSPLKQQENQETKRKTQKKETKK